MFNFAIIINDGDRKNPRLHRDTRCTLSQRSEGRQSRRNRRVGSRGGATLISDIPGLLGHDGGERELASPLESDVRRQRFTCALQGNRLASAAWLGQVWSSN